MFISDKYALYRFLNSYVASNGSTLFLRTGSSDDVPQTLRDLAASSVAAVTLAYKAQTTGTDNFLRRQFFRGRSIQPIGGYGQKRTYTVSGAQVLTYHAVPEKVDLNTGGVVLTPDAVALRAGWFGDYQTATTMVLAAGTVVTLDFGRTLRFRGLSAFATSSALSAATVSYLASDGITWTQILASAAPAEYQFDFTSRYVRINLSAAATLSSCFQFWAERGTEPAVRPITHGVMVPNLPASSFATIIDTTKVDYLGLVMDVGTDIKLDTVQTGKFGHVAVQDWLIPIKSTSKQGA